MNTPLSQRDRTWSPEVKAGVAKRLRQIAALVLVYAVLLFGAAGRLDWVWAWVLLGLYGAAILVNGVFLLRNHAETVAARAEAKGQKDWDRRVAGLWAIASLAGLVVAGLDARFMWTAPLALGWHLAGGVAYLLGFALFSWAMISNAYFIAVVRIQTERGQRVCTSGPYQFVRHPGYFGAILQAFAAPLLLGSVWALIPGALAVLLMVVRTGLEDRMLRAELEGYEAYAQKVRYRLIPGLW